MVVYGGQRHRLFFGKAPRLFYRDKVCGKNSDSRGSSLRRETEHIAMWMCVWCNARLAMRHDCENVDMLTFNRDSLSDQASAELQDPSFLYRFE